MYSLKKKYRSGFTLIELLIVVAIIGILAVVVVTSIVFARHKAKEARVKIQQKTVAQAFKVARLESGNTLMEITGSGCSECVCRTLDLRGIPETHACQWNWVNAMTQISNAIDGGADGLTEVIRDPWDSPYTLDENEGEFTASPCVKDLLKSAGPDGILQTSDDIIIAIPHSEEFNYCP